MIVHATQRFMAERMEPRMRSHPVDRAPLVTAPSVVLDIIREAVGQVVAGSPRRPPHSWSNPAKPRCYRNKVTFSTTMIRLKSSKGKTP
jgi:hypothetical protein